MLDILIMVDSVAIILLVLLQSGKSAGVSSAFMGGNGGLNLFSNVKERGPERTLSLCTLGAGILYLALVLIKLIVSKS
ncbi:MAG: preprotein translocase subunit SecG [Erysipelotrichaceae bacterium]|nr:preprotein translocase subunit SecG [Erysipelotrichaceae bacterium]MBQ4251693.1 preprotein translocase subunit SecG [Erysipelotrichaceae bacterium]MBQ7223200.1 preprotein translocase subunit SecG [Erysipelotrichaceae bacterium]